MFKALLITIVAIPVTVTFILAGQSPRLGQAQPMSASVAGEPPLPANIDAEADCTRADLEHAAAFAGESAAGEIVELPEPATLMSTEFSEPDQSDDAPVRERACDRCDRVMCHVVGRWTCHDCGITLIEHTDTTGQGALLPQCPHELAQAESR